MGGAHVLIKLNIIANKRKKKNTHNMKNRL